MLTLVRFVLVVLLIAAGFAVYQALSGMKKPPAETEAGERALPVTGIVLHSDDYPVTLRGYGTARARTRVSVSPEVGGLVVDIHPRLEAGEVIAKGDLLFRVDPRTYKLLLDKAATEIERLNAQIDLVRQQIENDKERLKLSRRSRELAESEYKRVKKLFDENEVGSLSGVEAAERAFTQAEEQVVALENALALYPIQLAELKVSLKGAEVNRETAALDLERTTVAAPFDARLEDVSLEEGQVVTPGQPVFTMVDDSLIEIPVSLDSREMSRWFPLGWNAKESNKPATLPSEGTITVTWMENPEEYSWPGRLARTERFRAESVTTNVVVEVPIAPGGDALLVEGMFCEVEIPGKTARSVFRVPASAVSHDLNIRLAVENRLKTLPVKVIHRSGDEIFIRGNVKNGDIMIATRLAMPLEGSLLDVSLKRE